MTRKIIILHNGWSNSKKDGEIQFIEGVSKFIEAKDLIQLYGIDRKKHVVIINGPRYIEGIHLSPMNNGGYIEESKKLGIL